MSTEKIDSRVSSAAVSEKQPAVSLTAMWRLEMPHTLENPPTSEFESNRLPSKGLQLSYFAPVLKNGTPTACLTSDGISVEASKWKNAIFMYVVDDCPSLKYINTYIIKQWHYSTPPDVFYHDEGYYVIRFASIEEKNTALCSGPYTIANRPVIVKSWSSDFDFQNEILRVVPLWIKLPNLPLICWGPESLSRIGSTLGNPLFADECTSQQSRISYARLLVEIDITRPLLHKILVESPVGKVLNRRLSMIGNNLPFARNVNRLGILVKQRNWFNPKQGLRRIGFQRRKSM